MRRSAEETAVRMGQLLHSMGDQLIASEQRIARQILELSCDIARQVLRQELAVAEQVVMPVIREALGMLVADAQAAVVRLHPQDLAPLTNTIRAEFPNLAVTLVADATLARGGCLVDCGASRIDARLETRLNDILARLNNHASLPADVA